MDRVITEMSKAKGDVERQLRKYIPEIIQECMAWAYLGKAFTFDLSSELTNKVNSRLIALSDAILEDIEARARKSIVFAEEEEDEDAILAYIKRTIGEEDIVQRIDKHCSTLRFFLEGWIAIGIVNKIDKAELTNQILRHIDNPFTSPLWRDAVTERYLSGAINGKYSFGKGNQRNVLSALVELARYAINEAYQYGCLLRYDGMGAIAYRTHRASSYPCMDCDELTMQVWPLDIAVLPAHPRCVCYTTPIFSDGKGLSDNHELTYSDQKSNGWVITDTSRRVKGSQNKQELDKYNKEKSMCVVLANNGYNVRHLGEISGISSSDIMIDGVPADLKKTKSANNIQSYAKKAIRQQGADLVVFEFEKETKEIYAELQNLKKYGIRAKYFFTGKNKVYDL